MLIATTTLSERIDDLSLDNSTADIDKQILADALKAARCKETGAAEIPGSRFRSFRFKLKEFGID